MPRPNKGAHLIWRPCRQIFYISWTERGRSKRKSTGETDRAVAERVLEEFIEERRDLLLRRSKRQKPTRAAIEAALESVLPNREVIYVIATQNGRFSKVGLSKNLRSRLKSLQTANPAEIFPTALFHCIHYSAASFEREIHAYLSDKRSSGEWYRLHPTTVYERILAAAKINSIDLVICWKHNRNDAMQSGALARSVTRPLIPDTCHLASGA